MWVAWHSLLIHLRGGDKTFIANEINRITIQCPGSTLTILSLKILGGKVPRVAAGQGEIVHHQQRVGIQQALYL